MADIFFSYASDNQAQIEPLVLALKERGYTVWWDHPIDAGSEVSQKVERELNAAHVAIVAWSKVANNSAQVKGEASVAHEQDKLIPICLDTERPPKEFRQYQALNLHAWNEKTSHPVFQTLISTVSAKFSGAPALSIPAANQAVPSPSKTSLFLASSIGAIVVGTFLAVMFWPF